MENKQNVRTYARIPRDVYAEVVKAANAHDRSINGEIIHLLRVALEVLHEKG